MSDFLFDHFVIISQIANALALIGVIVFSFLQNEDTKWKRSLYSIIYYVAILAIGMSGNIKRLSPLGLVHALIAFIIAAVAMREFKSLGRLFFLVPCLLILIVVLFNLSNDGRGLELFGRWLDAARL